MIFSRLTSVTMACSPYNIGYSRQVHTHGLPIQGMKLRQRKESVAGAQFFGYYILAMAL